MFNRKKASVKIKIIGGLLLAFVMIVVVGLVAYSSLSNLVDTISEQSKPDARLVTFKAMMSELSNAESSVRAYTITKDTIYLKTFYRSAYMIDDQLNELETLITDPVQITRMDTINALIDRKFAVLNELLLLKKDDRVRSALDKISENIAAVEDSEPKKRKGIRGWFKKRKDTIDPTVESIQEAVTEVKEEETVRTKQYSQAELELTQRDNAIMNRIRNIISEIELEETLLARSRAEKAAKLADRTTNIITGFSLVAFMLLILLGYVVFSDIAKTRRYNKMLKEAKKKAENLARVKEEFLANMSHEMRTPMNAIVGFSEQLSKTELDKKQSRFLDTIRSSSDHLLVVINDILDEAKLKAGGLSFKKEAFFIADILEGVYHTILPSAEEKQLDLDCKIDKHVPEVMIGDPGRLKQILINIAGNAVKFTDQGSVKIYCTSLLKNETSFQLKIEVIDTGIGIAKESLEKIFDDFYQTDSSVTKKHKGTGLGLAITKKLIELQDGRISVESEPGKGSKFIIIIPYGIGKKSDVVKEEIVDVLTAPLKDKAVLIADDEEYNRMLLNTILEKWNMRITLCEDGKKAIQELERNDYDLILMDIRMPNMNGLEATKVLRHKMKRNTKVPVIALTAAVREEDIKKCLGAGMNDFLSKPFKEAELYRKISSALGADNKKEPSKNGDGARKESVENKFSLDELEKISNGDEAFITEMLEVFVKNTRSGIEELQAAAKENNMERASMIAHKIVAPCRHLSLDKMVQDLKAIELKASEKNVDHQEIKDRIKHVSQEAVSLLLAIQEEIDQRLGEQIISKS